MSRLTPWLQKGRPHPRPQNMRSEGRGAPDQARQRVVGKVSEAAKSVTGIAATDLLTSAGHGYSAGDEVSFSGLTGGTGINAGQIYFVIGSGLTANDFRVSATRNGSTIDFTTNLTAGTVARRHNTYVTV
jgi:hypothetical protein